MLTNDIISYEQLGPGNMSKNCWKTVNNIDPDQMPCFEASDMSTPFTRLGKSV